LRLELSRGGYVVSAGYAPPAAVQPAAQSAAAPRPYSVGSWARRAALGAAVAVIAIASIVLLRSQPLAEHPEATRRPVV
jgi:hypothetical protein